MADTQTADAIAAFVRRVGPGDLSEAARERLKLCLLDALGCAIGALGGEPVRQIRAMVDTFGGAGLCTLIGGGSTAPDRAALVNGCLVRYLDFMDNFAAPGEVCHPSDNIAAMLSAADYADASGEDLRTGIAVAFQVQCRPIETLPTMQAGLNYTTPLAFSVAAGAARLLGLDQAQTLIPSGNGGPGRRLSRQKAADIRRAIRTRGNQDDVAGKEDRHPDRAARDGGAGIREAARGRIAGRRERDGHRARTR